MFSHFKPHRCVGYRAGYADLAQLEANSPPSSSSSSSSDTPAQPSVSSTSMASSSTSPTIPSASSETPVQPSVSSTSATPSFTSSTIPPVHVAASPISTSRLWLASPELWFFAAYVATITGGMIVGYKHRDKLVTAIQSQESAGVVSNNYDTLIKFVKDYGHIWGPTFGGLFGGSGATLIGGLFNRASEIRNHVRGSEAQSMSDLQKEMTDAFTQAERYALVINEEKAKKDGDYFKAEPLFDRGRLLLLALYKDRDPDTVLTQYMPVLTKQIECLYHLQAFDKAIQLLSDLIDGRVVPTQLMNLADAYKLRGLMYLNRGLLVPAKQDLDQALSINPTLSNAYILSLYLAERYEDVMKFIPFKEAAAQEHTPLVPLLPTPDLLQFAVIEAYADAARRLNHAATYPLFSLLMATLPHNTIWIKTKIACRCLLATIPPANDAEAARLILLMNQSCDLLQSMSKHEQLAALQDERFLPLWCYVGNVSGVGKLLGLNTDSESTRREISWPTSDLMRITTIGSEANAAGQHNEIKALLAKYEPAPSPGNTRKL